MGWPFMLCAAALSAAALISAPASGASNRIWVSGHGSDVSGCGAPTNPCRSFQYAHDNIASGGEIDVLDPAGFGAVTITKPVSIINDGVGTAGVQAALGGVGVTIATGAFDAVRLRGLTIEGSGVGDIGIAFKVGDTGGSVEIANCVVRHFTAGAGTGIAIQGNVHFSIVDSIVSDNTVNGVDIEIDGQSYIAGGVIARTSLTNNGTGLLVNGVSLGSGGPRKVAVVESVISNNGSGVALSTSDTVSANPTELALRNVTISNNGTGLSAGGAGTGGVIARIAHSVITANTTGVAVTTGGTVYSYVDNNIDGNTTNLSGSLTTLPQQ